MNAADEPYAYLKRIGESGPGPHDIATAALMFAAFDHAGTKLEPFREHLAELGEAARAEVEFVADAEQAARGLGQILTRRYGYDGDHAHYNDPNNADLISVIQRRRGLPVALGILYMHAARGAGLRTQGLSSPGHFLLMLSAKGGEAILDPFNGGAAVERERLKGPPLLADLDGANEPSILEPVSDIDVLLRLQNNIKTRALQARNVQRAVDVLSRMVLIAPARSYLWLELGRFQETLGALGGARAAYEKCLQHSGDPSNNEAALALSSLKRRLN